MSGRVEAGFYRTELSSTRFFYHDGKPVCHAFLQNGKLVKSLAKKYKIWISCHYVTYGFHIQYGKLFESLANKCKIRFRVTTLLMVYI